LKRIERAELQAQDELFSIHLSAFFQIELDERLPNRKKMLDCIIFDQKIESREVYYRILERLMQKSQLLLRKIQKVMDYLWKFTDEKAEMN
jgi:RNA polymerase primary sigma factor